MHPKLFLASSYALVTFQWPDFVQRACWVRADGTLLIVVHEREGTTKQQRQILSRFVFSACALATAELTLKSEPMRMEIAYR